MHQLLTKHLLLDTAEQFKNDWARQRRTANDILNRLQTMEGVILADQVGMGKTYVALAVIASCILAQPDNGRAVVFVPAAVADKWVNEWRKFSASLLHRECGIRCVSKPIRSGEDFLKKLDDPAETREHILIVTHTALTTTLKDTFIQLALLYYATRYVRNSADLRSRIAKWSLGLGGLIRDSRFSPERVSGLLQTPPKDWKKKWFTLTAEQLDDDPVPMSLETAVGPSQLSSLRLAIQELPIRSSGDIQRRLEIARKTLAGVTQAAWKQLLSATEQDIPLMVVDEAHRLKNPATQISKLFAPSSNTEESGAFAGIFRRMLFLTATPFELGHSELIQVLGRMSAVRPLNPTPAVSLDDRLEGLQKCLTAAQRSALALDLAWGHIGAQELRVFDGWSLDAAAPEGISANGRVAWEAAKTAVIHRTEMNRALRPWIIRHEREKRRTYRPGAQIVSHAGDSSGLQIGDDAALPFLLAARAQSVALEEQGLRPHFAYGIVSSFEAFGRRDSGQHVADRDSDLPSEDLEFASPKTPSLGVVNKAVDWYRSEIDRSLSAHIDGAIHPKVLATAEKAAQLWTLGEKCVVFSWYIRTGLALSNEISRRINHLILDRAARALGTQVKSEVEKELTRISDRIFRTDSASHDRIRQRLRAVLSESVGGCNDVIELVADSAIRHLRTPSYLVRYTPLTLDMNDDDVWRGVTEIKLNGLSMIDRWCTFALRMASVHRAGLLTSDDALKASEFTRIKTALTGATSGDDDDHARGASLGVVRRAYGGTDRDVRERLIASFNTPFSPDILVASSVMGEGIDLHQECRFVVHHDLDWNPSVLEQRTGRLDRIGAFAERVGQPIEVYEPYLAGTHDEKMFRVVKDRAQWFDVVMGRSTGNDEKSTDREEGRVELHQVIRAALSMDLSSPA